MTDPIRTDTPLVPKDWDRSKTTEVWDCLNPRDPLVYVRRRKFTATRKWCPACAAMLPHDRFWPDKSKPSGRYVYCKLCGMARNRDNTQRRTERTAT